MTDAEPTQLGRYELLRQIARGGMGEIYVARARGASGFEKTVIIKRILPHLAEEQEFVDKFVDEAHIVTHLTHGNIVPVFDMGEENGELYIAMEYIPGRDLRDVLKRAKDDDYAIPVDVGLYIAAETCKGLAYAHRRTDDAGKPLDLVHRDVSPSNILLSKDGEVKIVDFGIAKASGKISKSITGRLQGKFCYMSPEQAAGRSVDHRSDIFSTGVVLYELLTNARPFEGAQDLESLDKVRNHTPPPPSALRPDIPTDVDAIVMRALEKEAGDRYAQVDEFERALLTHLYASGGLTSRQVASSLTELFPEGIERPEVRSGTATTPRRGVSLDDALSAEMERLLSGKTPSNHGVVDAHMDTATGAGLSVQGGETRSLVVEGQASTVMAESGVKIRIGDDGGDMEALVRSTTAEMPGLGPARHELTPSGQLPAVPAGYELTPSRGLTPTSGLTPAAGLTPPSGLTPSGGFVAADGLVHTGPLVIQPPRSRVSRYGVVAIGVLVVVLAATVGLLVWDSYLASPVLVVQTVPAGAVVLLDGEPVGKGGHAIEDLEPGEHRVSARADGFLLSEEQVVVLEPGRSTRINVRLVPEPRPEKIHRVSFVTEPAGAAVIVLREVRGKTPLDTDIPATGADVRLVLPAHQDIELILEPDKIEPAYHLVFARDDAGVADVEPDAGVPADDVEPTEDSKDTVRVRFDSTPSGARIVAAGRTVGVTPQSVNLPDGTVSVRLEKEGYEPYKTRVNTRSQRRVSATLVQTEVVAVAAEPKALVNVTFRVFAGTVGRPVPSTVKVNGLTRSVDARGEVSIKLAPGSYGVVAEASGYPLQARRTITVTEDMANTTFSMNLQPTGP